MWWQQQLIIKKGLYYPIFNFLLLHFAFARGHLEQFEYEEKLLYLSLDVNVQHGCSVTALLVVRRVLPGQNVRGKYKSFS